MLGISVKASGKVAGPSAARVLLVQPERDDREMYCEYLSRRGLSPLPVANATDALMLAAKVDIIVTGILLPGPIDGIELLRRLRDDAATKNTPVIVLTSCAWNSERERAEQGGCDVFLAKPCLPEDLVREVRRLLAARPRGRRPPVKAQLTRPADDRRTKRIG
jgi:two-component system, cell cycle response regulator DivK